MPSVVLASASPRRRELLQQIAVSFEVCTVDVDESMLPDESISQLLVRLSRQKALAGLEKFPEAVVIGSDTMVVVDGLACGKPQDRDHGLHMLKSLSGNTHQVMTGVAVVSAEREDVLIQCSTVRFNTLSEAEIVAYWDTGEPLDKAGGYAIQGLAAQFIESIEGSYSGIMGLPLFETAQLLKRHGVQTLIQGEPD